MTLYTKVSHTKTGIKKTLWVNYTLNGKRFRKSLKLEDTKSNRLLAERKILPQMQLKLVSGEFFKNSTIPTLDEFAKKSFEMHSSSRKQATMNDYQSAYNLHISPILGDYAINAFKASLLQTWQNDLLKKLSPRRVKNIRAVLSGIFQDAYKDEILDKNPLSLVPTPKLSKVDISPFSISEIFEILEKAEGQFKNFYALAFFTGMRSGEMIGLKWSDVNIEHLEINIKRTIKMGVISTPKTNNSIRTIEILDILVPYMQEQYAITGDSNSYVFLNEQNEHFYDIKRIRNTHWKNILEKCNLDYRPIYHTRHTFATMMLENNEDILWVSNMLGHSNPSMTLSKYAKYVKRKEKKRAQFLSKELSPKDTELAPSFSKVA